MRPVNVDDHVPPLTVAVCVVEPIVTDTDETSLAVPDTTTVAEFSAAPEVGVVTVTTGAVRSTVHVRVAAVDVLPTEIGRAHV